MNIDLKCGSMKLLSIWEPWATLMAIGEKKIETRSWSTAYRGWVAIHASKGGLCKRDLCAVYSKEPFYSTLMHRNPKLGFGCIIAVGYLDSCHRTEDAHIVHGGKEHAFGNYAPGRFAWRFLRMKQLETPIPFKAAQGLINVPIQTMEQICHQWNP